VRAFREHLDRLKTWEERFQRLHARQIISRLEFLEFQVRRIEAEAFLARELKKPAAK
jgi:hypothetical protein